MSSKLPLSSRAVDAGRSLVVLARNLVRLQGSVRDLEKEMKTAIGRVAPGRRESARNLVHYVALRQHDLRDLQIRLSQRGLSSLSHSESCVMGSLLEASLRAHESLALRGHADAKRKLPRLEKERSAAMPWQTAKHHLHEHTREMLGPRPADRHIYIMVTAPSAIEADRAWMLKMFSAGMNVLRVNCAHEGEREWSQVIGALGEARKASGKECRILMDVAGPKIRTGAIGGGRHVDVKNGDTLVLTRRITDGAPPRRNRKGRIHEPGVIACTLPAALDHLEIGHRVLFDDGRILTVVESVDKKRGDFLLRVGRTQKATAKLRAEKGINLPDTPTTLPSLTEDDLRALAFIAKHADAVSLSFVRTPDDVRRLHEELDRLGRPDIGVVLKIEKREGFENLPRMLLEGLRRPPLAVMIARGDLAVEVGFERLAELQEEILWLCEASHVPAIWATQVLDTLARTGVPSRAEVTDAAASVAAECVMLNKGPFVAEAVTALSDILRRMEKHHYKKRSLFRKLRVSTFAERLTGGSEKRTESGNAG